MEIRPGIRSAGYWDRGKDSASRVDVWLLWVIFLSTLLIFISLWMISSPLWHLTVSGITLILVGTTTHASFKKIVYIVGLVAFLAFMQILFSPFVRAMFLNALEHGFTWSDWQYLLFAVERFAWPLVVVTAFQSRLGNPAAIVSLTSLLTPLKWLGFKIDKLQVVILLALKFIPSLQREWQRFMHFQAYFGSRVPRKTMMQKLQYWQGVFKAIIAHTIHRSVSIGDILALRGIQQLTRKSSGKSLIPALFGWLMLGILFFFVDMRILYLWFSLTIWMAFAAVSIDGEVSQ